MEESSSKDFALTSLPRSTNKEILRRDMSPQMKGATASFRNWTWPST